ncbi:MAG: glycosyltransferase family 39 protein, partial [Verrucomicrobiales bacterium]
MTGNSTGRVRAMWWFRWRTIVESCGRGPALAALALGVLALVLLIVLFEMRAPWEAQVRELREGSSTKRVEYHAAVGLWWAVLGNAVACAILAGTVRRWGKLLPGGARPRSESSRENPAVRRVFLLALVAAVVAGAVYRAPRLGHSFWNDEEYALRRFALGYYRVTDEGDLKFRPVRWVETLFRNEIGNNHVFHSLEARAGLAIWRSLAHPQQEGAFSEAAARFFPFLSGLASIAAVGYLGLFLGRPVSGAVAAFLLALSPWHLRYSVESRGYASMILFVLLGLIFLLRALDSGRWRWWAAYGVAQCLALFCFLGVVYLVLAQNVAALVCIVFRGETGRRRVSLGRFAVANMLSAMAFFQLMLPSLIQQFADFDASKSRANLMRVDGAFLRDFWAHLSAGIPWGEIAPGMHLGTSIAAEAALNPFFGVFITILLPTLLVTGIGGLLWRGGWRARLVVAVFVGAVGLALAHNAFSGPEVYPWYMVYVAPGFALALGWNFGGGKA